MNVMAESTAGAMGKEEKVGKISVRRMNSFTIEALRGFGGYRIPCASGVGGDQSADTLQRIAIAQRHALFRFGFRFPTTESLRKAIATASFVSYAHLHE